MDANGDPASGYFIYTYTAGSSTPQTTYTTAVGNVANANPIELNAAGYPSSGASVVGIWLTEGVSYKFVLETAGGSVIWTRDAIVGIGDTSVSADQWVAGPAPTYISATSFSLVGDQTSTFHPGRRLKSSNTAGDIYSLILTSTFGVVTTVTVVNDSGSLDSGLSAVSYGLLSSANPSSPLLSDALPIVRGSADATKRLRMEVDAITTNTVRVLTMPDEDVTLAAATDTARGTIELATLAEVQTGTDTGRAVTPSTFQNGGLVLIADDVSVQSGTSVTITTAIPSWAKRITIMFYEVSTNGTDNYLVQIGAGGLDSTGYVSESAIVTTAAATVVTSTAGFIMAVNSASAATTGVMTLTKMGSDFDGLWIASGTARFLTTSTVSFSGSNVVGANVTHVGITTTGGANTFDASGIIAIRVE
jgi:hypothetical protein